MKYNSEIDAILRLLDDPDNEVFESISNKILDYGSSIVPNLESYWEQTDEPIIQDRIEQLIQKVNLNEVKQKLGAWENEENSSLLDGIILLSQYMYPNLDEKLIHKTLKSIHSSCWLELNNYLTPLEEIHIINSIIYSMYKFSCEANSIHQPAAFYINEVLQRHSGNQYSMALLYQLIAKMLDLPIFAMKISNFIVLGYFETVYDFNNMNVPPKHKPQFYIEPTEGTVLSQQDVDSFVKKYEIETDTDNFVPIKNQDFLFQYISALKNAYRHEGKEDKMEDIQALIEHLFPNR